MNQFRAFLRDDAIPLIEEVLDFEDLEHDECAAMQSFPLCGSRWCQAVGCLVDKLARAKAAVEQCDSGSGPSGLRPEGAQGEAPQSGGDSRIAQTPPPKDPSMTQEQERLIERLLAEGAWLGNHEDGDTDPFQESQQLIAEAATELRRSYAECDALRAMLVDNPNDVAAGVPEDVIEAGIAVQDRANEDHRNYVPGVTTDWDEGMLAAAIFKAMLRTTLHQSKESGNVG